MAINGSSTCCIVVLWLVIRIGDFKLLLELLYDVQVLQVLGTQLRLCLLLTDNLLLFELLNLQLQCVEVQRSLLLRPVQLFAMELLQASVLFDSLLEIGLILRRDLLYLLVEPLYFKLTHHELMSELLKS